MHGPRQSHVTRDVITPDYDVTSAWTGNGSDASVDGCTLVPRQPVIHHTAATAEINKNVVELREMISGDTNAKKLPFHSLFIDKIPL